MVVDRFQLVVVSKGEFGSIVNFLGELPASDRELPVSDDWALIVVHDPHLQLGGEVVESNLVLGVDASRDRIPRRVDELLGLAVIVHLLEADDRPEN